MIVRPAPAHVFALFPALTILAFLCAFAPLRPGFFFKCRFLVSAVSNVWVGHFGRRMIWV